MVEQELVAIDNGKDGSIEFVSDQICHFEPLPFGGFLAFDPEYIYFYADSLARPID